MRGFIKILQNHGNGEFRKRIDRLYLLYSSP
jgi:hypothetical protein